MQTIVKAAIGFLERYSAALLINIVDIILEAMTVAKATFTTPNPPLADVRAANDALRVAVNEAADGSREKIAIRRARHAELKSLVRLLASYVTVTSNGDMAKLLSSGFPYQKPTRSRIGQLPEPEPPYVRQGKLSGVAVATVPSLYGAKTYNWRVALASAPTDYVANLQTTGSRAEIPGLTPGQLYNFSANAVGAAGTSNWSAPGQFRVV